MTADELRDKAARELAAYHGDEGLWEAYIPHLKGVIEIVVEACVEKVTEAYKMQKDAGLKQTTAAAMITIAMTAKTSIRALAPKEK